MPHPAATAALASLLAASGAPAPVGASFERGFQTFAAAGVMLPPDKIYVPKHLDGPVPLVVVLHGCEQDADAIAASARWNELAEKEGFLVLYPNQQWGLNPYNCWNWFLPVNEAPGLGEPAAIMGAILAAKAVYPVDSSRVYVAGISAGGAEAATMLSCYPYEFAAGAIHSGVAYGVAAGPATAKEIMKNGPGNGDRAGICEPSSFKGGIFILQGLADTAVNPTNAERLATDFAGKGAERVVATVPPSGETYGYRRIDLAGGRVREILVDGLGHAWSGGPPGAIATDPRGPDATGLMWSFFSGAR
jgi:poly(hydroxyalkanoate) depolymerase family esterase